MTPPAIKKWSYKKGIFPWGGIVDFHYLSTSKILPDKKGNYFIYTCCTILVLASTLNVGTWELCLLEICYKFATGKVYSIQQICYKSRTEDIDYLDGAMVAMVSSTDCLKLRRSWVQSLVVSNQRLQSCFLLLNLC